MLSLSIARKTWAHSVGAWWKLAALVLITTMLFPVTDVWVLGVALLAATGLTVSLGRTACVRTVSLGKGLLPFVALMIGFHLVFGTLVEGLAISFRLLALVLMANVVTMTTPLRDIMRIVETLIAPLAFTGLSPRTVSVAVGLMVRFVPAFMSRAAHMREAWAARSHRRPRWNLVIPLGMSVLDDSDRVSEALRARGGVSTVTHTANAME